MFNSFVHDATPRRRVIFGLALSQKCFFSTLVNAKEDFLVVAALVGRYDNIREMVLRKPLECVAAGGFPSYLSHGLNWFFLFYSRCIFQSHAPCVLVQLPRLCNNIAQSNSPIRTPGHYSHLKHTFPHCWSIHFRVDEEKIVLIIKKEIAIKIC